MSIARQQKIKFMLNKRCWKHQEEERDEIFIVDRKLGKSQTGGERSKVWTEFLMHFHRRTKKKIQFQTSAGIFLCLFVTRA